MAPAVLRRIMPRPKEHSPHSATYRAAQVTARSTLGWDSVALACVLDSRAWPMKKAAKLVRNATTRAIAVNTEALAAPRTRRLGITVSDVRIMPVEYSEVIASVPSTTITSWPSRASPTMLDWLGSKPARCAAGICGHRDASPAQNATDQ